MVKKISLPNKGSITPNTLLRSKNVRRTAMRFLGPITLNTIFTFQITKVPVVVLTSQTLQSPQQK